jgi:DNA-binding Lrp family transcriptional regulator
MRPQDIIVLIKLASECRAKPTLPILSRQLGISSSEISKSVRRSQYSGLIIGDKISVSALLEFIKYGLPYVFPVRPGAPVRGIPTAVSHPKISEPFSGDEVFVWPHASGTARGYTINPLYPSLPEAVLTDGKLYYAAALVDVLRMGKTREKQYAETELKKLLKP